MELWLVLALGVGAYWWATYKPPPSLFSHEHLSDGSLRVVFPLNARAAGVGLLPLVIFLHVDGTVWTDGATQAQPGVSGTHNDADNSVDLVGPIQDTAIHSIHINGDGTARFVRTDGSSALLQSDGSVTAYSTSGAATSLRPDGTVVAG